MKALNKQSLLIHKKINTIILLLMLIISLTPSCRDFVEVGPSSTAMTTQAVFDSDETANAAMVRIYVGMTQYFTTFISGQSSLTNLSGMAADEFKNYNANSNYGQFEQNSLLPTNTFIAQNWTDLYGYMYSANAVIEGVTASARMTVEAKNKLTGEAKFMRAFLTFYLVNLWGSVPLITSTDYTLTAKQSRAQTTEVYQQIISDLKTAVDLLPEKFESGKIRPTQAAAAALLARVYLYTGQWTEAEATATSVINNYSLTLEAELNDVFLIPSNESIWHLESIVPYIDTYDGNTFILRSAPRLVSVSQTLLNAFEANDKRKQNWIGKYTRGTDSWYYPFKYKTYRLAEATSAKTEYLVVLRLAEQYLIRAEARAQLNNLSAAAEDLNTIRTRAGLSNVVPSDKNALLFAIEQERRVELFSEGAHRWLDLKRTGRADAVLSSLKAQWQSTDVLFPLPKNDLDRNLSLTQNPGY